MLMFLKNLRFYAEPFIHRQPAFRTCAKTINQTVPTTSLNAATTFIDSCISRLISLSRTVCLVGPIQTETAFCPISHNLIYIFIYQNRTPQTNADLFLNTITKNMSATYPLIVFLFGA